MCVAGHKEQISPWNANPDPLWANAGILVSIEEKWKEKK